MKITLNRSKINMALLWICITSVGPFMFLAIPGHPHKILTFLCLVIMFAQLISSGIRVDKTILFIISAQSIFFILFSAYHNDLGYSRLLLQMISIMIVYLFIQKCLSLERVARSILVVMIAMGIGSTIVFFLALNDLIKPVSYFLRPRRDDELIFNYILTFSNAIFKFDNFQIVRISGYFGEPSVMVIYIMYALAINKLLYNNKKVEIILLFSGLFTLSVGFYIMSALYLILFYLNAKNIRIFLSVLLIVASLIYFVSSRQESSEIISKLKFFTIDRFEISIDENRLIEGDTRSGSFFSSLYYFKEAPWFGLGEKNAFNAGYTGSSIMIFFVFSGVIGVLIMFLHFGYFILIPFIEKKGDILLDTVHYKVVILLAVNYLITPEILGILPYLIVIIMIHLAKKRYSSLNRRVQKKDKIGTHKSVRQAVIISL